MQSEEKRLTLALISTICLYICFELMFKYMPLASIYNFFVFSGINKFEGTMLICASMLSLIFAVLLWIEVSKEK